MDDDGSRRLRPKEEIENPVEGPNSYSI